MVGQLVRVLSRGSIYATNNLCVVLNLNVMVGIVDQLSYSSQLVELSAGRRGDQSSNHSN